MNASNYSLNNHLEIHCIIGPLTIIGTPTVCPLVASEAVGHPANFRKLLKRFYNIEAESFILLVLENPVLQQSC
jgi:hypothetical protein